MIRRALLSVSDKTGLVDFATTLAEAGVELLSTGGTAKLLADAGLAVVEVADYTGFPEMLDGRVKTLHPKIHGGLLARRDVAAHIASIDKHGIGPIDLLVVNLYPFEATVAAPGCTLDDAIENIDIGGPAMVRSAAKNWQDVVVRDRRVAVRRPSSRRARRRRHGAARRRASRSRSRRSTGSRATTRAISDYLSSIADVPEDGATVERARFPAQANATFVKLQDLRYGENPHQQAALYRDPSPRAGRARHGATAAGQGAVVQQPRRRRRGVGMREDVRHRRRDGLLRDRQAREPVRRGARRDAGRRVRARVRDRSDVGVRRHHRVQPRARRRGRRGAVEAVRRGADRAGVRRRRARAAREEGEPARARGADGRRRRHAVGVGRPRRQADRRRGCSCRPRTTTVSREATCAS